MTADIRRRIVLRAAGACEYCLVHENDTTFRHEVDHIISLKHGGAEDESLFDPQRQRWSDHFSLRGSLIVPLTPEGEVTVQLLRLNDSDRVTLREALRERGRYPIRW